MKSLVSQTIFSRRLCASLWCKPLPDNYPVVCTIEADTSLVQPKKKVSRYGTTYYEISFQIAILFGLTELKAQIIYKENVSAMFKLKVSSFSG
jgi:hypothetical protein